MEQVKPRQQTRLRKYLNRTTSQILNGIYRVIFFTVGMSLTAFFRKRFNTLRQSFTTCSSDKVSMNSASRPDTQPVNNKIKTR